MRLHRLFREKQPLADLAVHETVRDELQDLDLPRRRFLLELAQRRWREGNHRAAATRAATRGSRLESAAVIAIPVQDLLTLGGVHKGGIGLAVMPL